MNLVAIDPGARRFAFSVFHDNTLVACGYASHPGELAPHLDSARSYLWVFEVPRNYDSFAVAHKDLDRLRAMLKRIRQEVVRPGETVKTQYPSQWKANVPKRIHHERAWKVLRAKERIVLPDRPKGVNYAHDVHDAVALGLTHLGRLTRGRRSRR